MSLQVKVQGRELQKCVNYTKPSKIIQYGDAKSTEQSFLESRIREEVNLLPRKERRKLKKLMKMAKVTSLSSLIVAIPTLVSAEEIQSIPEVGLPNPNEILELIQILFQILTYLSLGAGAMALLLGAISIYLPKKYNKSKEMTTNGIKGIIQTLLVPIIIAILLISANILLGSSTNFHLPL